MAAPDLQVEVIFRALEEHGVRYLLIGGLAAVAHGSPIPTQDVDITPESSAENLSRLSDALRTLGARVRAEGVEDGLPFAHDAASLASPGMWNLITPYGYLDISFVPSGTHGYDDLQRDAVEISVYGLRIRLASLADIVRSKQAANRPKDQRALPVLRELLARRARPAGPAPGAG